jgi:hypothetical protein
MNLYTKKHLDTCVAMIGLNILYFGTERVSIICTDMKRLIAGSQKCRNRENTGIK